MREIAYSIGRHGKSAFLLAFLFVWIATTSFRDAFREHWSWFVLALALLWVMPRWLRPRRELYREYPEPDEQRTIDAIIALLVRRLEKQYARNRVLRDTHPKSNGLIRAKFRVLDDLPPEHKVGLFAEAREYDCWLRFSNSADEVTADEDRDFRGLAIKLFEVPGDKLQDDESGTFDFLLLGFDRFFAGNPKEFLSFFSHVTHYPAALGQLLYFLPRPRNLINTLLGRRTFGNPLEIEWHSVSPYRFGTRAVKYHVPSAIPPVRPIGTDPDYLRHRLEASLRQQSWTLDFEVQFQLDPYRHPIESTLRPWRSSPFHKVAEIHIPQQEFGSKERREFDENMTFNPWHCLPEHRPLGSINRARRDVMRAIQEFRLARNGKRRSDVVNASPVPPSTSSPGRGSGIAPGARKHGILE